MAHNAEIKPYFVGQESLPRKFPTNRHGASFWEALGRAIATFGFLEEILGKAIFAWTAPRCNCELEFEEAYKRWLPQLERALTDQLWSLSESFGKAVRNHSGAGIKEKENVELLVSAIKETAEIRNVLCHGSWRTPSFDGRSVPFFVNRRMEVFETPIDVAYLEQVQRVAAGLACDVINTVTQRGWQFPSSASPGKPV